MIQYVCRSGHSLLSGGIKMSLVGFIGVGNMGGAMVNGISARAKDITLYAYDIDQSKIEALQGENINIAASAKEICEQAKYIVLSVKPQFYLDVFKQIKDSITKEHVVIAIAPGFSIEKIKSYLGEDIKVVRAMPNTPALIGEGMTAYAFLDEEINNEEHDVIKAMFSSFGKSLRIEEDNMEAIMAISGSSPAYAYVMMEAMADAGVSFGLGRQDSYMLAAQALKGAAQMVLDTKKHPAQLKDDVCSPGGTTIQAILTLEETQFRNSIIKAMTANYDKAKSMN